MRFCSRCGLQINEVAEWLAGTGQPYAQEEAQADTFSPRRKGMRQGAKIMFWGGVLLPIFFGLSIVVDSPIPLFVPFAILLAGLSILLYSRLFAEETPFNRSRLSQDAISGARTDASALPPASGVGINSMGRGQAGTAEMVQPPSVTDHTTKLLDRE